MVCRSLRNRAPTVRSSVSTSSLPNATIMHNMIVYGADLDEYSMLIGMDVIRKTDFLITNADGKTTFQFRTPSEGGVEL